MNALVVYKKSTLEFYANSPDKKTADYATLGEEADRLKASDEEQKRTLEAVVESLEWAGIEHNEIYRAQLDEGIEKSDLVIVVGGDGTLLETAHYVKKTPILGVNSDSANSTGFYSIGNRENIEKIIETLDNIPRTVLARLELTLNGEKVKELALNDVLIAHQNPAAMTRYKILEEGSFEEYHSSGLLICTASGSTGFMYNEDGIVMPLSSTQMQIKHRSIRGSTPYFADALEIASKTREGLIYIDGAHLHYQFLL